MRRDTSTTARAAAAGGIVAPESRYVSWCSRQYPPEAFDSPESGTIGIGRPVCWNARMTPGAMTATSNAASIFWGCVAMYFRVSDLATLSLNAPYAALGSLRRPGQPFTTASQAEIARLSGPEPDTPWTYMMLPFPPRSFAVYEAMAPAEM